MKKRASNNRTKDAPKSEDTSPKYHVDFKSLEERGRSPRTLLAQCACDEHIKSILSLQTSGQKKGSRSPMETIESCCSKKPGYLTSRTPLLEAIFKVLIANQNRPMTASQISESLISEGVDNNGLRDLSASIVARIVEKDTYYGFASVPSETQAVSRS